MGWAQSYEKRNRRVEIYLAKWNIFQANDQEQNNDNNTKMWFATNSEKKGRRFWTKAQTTNKAYLECLLKNDSRSNATKGGGAW